MFQVERLNVVNKTLATLLTEVKEGQIEDPAKMRNIGHEIFETIVTINEEITLNQMRNEISEGQHNEDS